MFTIDTDLPEALRPYAWLIGRWEGAGVVGYASMEESLNFGQEVVASHDGRDFIRWESTSWILDKETGEKVRPSGTELGFWRPRPNDEVELLLAHPTGIVEMYFGKKDPAKPAVELVTDGVLRVPEAKEYNAGQRMYGLVNSNLMWVMDMAATGHPMQSHVSAELKRVE